MKKYTDYTREEAIMYLADCFKHYLDKDIIYYHYVGNRYASSYTHCFQDFFTKHNITVEEIRQAIKLIRVYG